MQATEPSTGASGGEDNGGFGYFDNLWNWLSSIVSWLQSCAESITQIPSLIWQNVSSLPQLIWNFIKDIPQMVWNFFENSFNTVSSIIQNIFSTVVSLPENILNGIKFIFIPDTEHINNSIDNLVNNFKNAFGVNSFDISEVFGTEAEIGNQQGTIQVGSITFTGTVFDSSFLLKAVNTFRPAIRGFIIFLLVLYNINQFLRFIGQEGLSLGSLFASSRKDD